MAISRIVTTRPTSIPSQIVRKRQASVTRTRWLPATSPDLLLLVAVAGYKIYLDVFDAELESVHALQVERIEQLLAGRDSFQFAVVGNVNNSIGVFERQIVPMLDASDAEFVVSAGDAVSDSGEDKYRSLRGSLARLDMPYLLTFGENEAAGLGGFRFYRQFGPYFFSFTAGDARFVFLDTTGETPYAWQLRWLEEVLEGPEPRHTFVFMGRPLLRPAREPVFVEEEDYLDPGRVHEALMEVIGRHRVDAVFAGTLPLFDHQVVNGTQFVTTGGAGGLVVGGEGGFHHFVMVSVAGGRVSIEVRRLEVSQHPVLQTLESLWLFVHSLFFVGYLNFLLLLSALVLGAVKLHGLVFAERDYYPRFDVDPAPFAEKPLRVAMFTNNYLPFIGGVPLSVARLRRGLLTLGKRVLVVAPGYATADGEEEGVLRVPSILRFGRRGEFRLANAFLPRIGRGVRAFRPDVVHLHHPFWLGSVGLWLARRLDVPAIYTYHTRFEHYAHYVPVPGRLFRNLVSHYLIKRFANKCWGVVVPTPSAREYLRTLGVRSRIVVRPTGIDHEAFEDVDPAEVEALRERLGLGDEPVLVSASRLSREKNIDFMLDGVADLARRVRRPFRFVLVGDGDERARLEARIETMGLDDRVVLTGSVAAERMPLYYHLGEVFLFASTTETQGMVVLEAMAAGLPVVAVRSSGVDDLVQNGINGYKTPEDVATWAGRVEELLAGDALRRDFGVNARAFAAQHGIEAFAREILAFYARALAAREEQA